MIWKSVRNSPLTGTLSISFFISFFLFPASGQEIYISGRVTDPSQVVLPGATVTITLNSRDFSTSTKSDGTYFLKVSGLYPLEPELLEVGDPYPNPFSHSVKIPVVISTGGDLYFYVYDLAGRKIIEFKYPSLTAGAYIITWDGSSQSGSPQAGGYYIYAVSFSGRTSSGRLVKAQGITGFSDPNGIEEFMPAGDAGIRPDGYKIPVVVRGLKTGYHNVRLTNIFLSGDTVIDLTMLPFYAYPYVTSETDIMQYNGTEYRPMILKGVNLGSSPPGYFPGEIAYAISPEMYEKWIEMMAGSGFNAVRVYTLHPPVFYEKLAEYNWSNPSNPLFLFQGVWLDEVNDPSDPVEYDLIARSDTFAASIREVMDCMHGSRNIAFRPGRAYGQYSTDVSPWIAGYIIGREIIPQEVDSTNQFHPGVTQSTGMNFSITGALPSEVFVTRMLDEAIRYEWQSWGVKRTISMSSWPTLDPLVHPTEIYTDEDIVSIDITGITELDENKSLFASYHAYPYYPDFISDDPVYRGYSDENGPNSYLGYITALKGHYTGIPLVIGEFGVPSSWGSAHESFSGMPHGGLSEEQQGSDNIRMMKNILSAGCAGGFMFAWMDEWFKPTWIVQYLEAYGTLSGDVMIPTRQLWHNICSPEQNFGLIQFEETIPNPWHHYSVDRTDASISTVNACHDNTFFLLEIQLGSPPSDGDTLMIAFDTYLEDTGESILPGGMLLSNRSEFLLFAVKGADTADFFVTEAYDMYGMTPRFNLSNPEVQKYKSIISDNASWKLMQWINSGISKTVFNIGKLPAGESTGFSFGERSAVVWNGTRILIRIPWTMLYFHDPTQMKVIDGAESYDGGFTFDIITRVSDGIAVSAYYKSSVINTSDRYTWNTWLVVPQTTEKPKKSLEMISAELNLIPEYGW